MDYLLCMFPIFSELVDVCNKKSIKSIWGIGIKQSEGNKKARVYFSLKTDRSSVPSVIFSNTDYIPDHWVHITAVYTGKQTKLFINNMQVAASFDQKGDAFSHMSAKCKEVRLGGSVSERSYFRGTVDEVRIWNSSISQAEIVRNLYATHIHHDQSLFFRESFKNMKTWRKEHRKIPKLVPSDIKEVPNSPALQTPFCGKTVCDDPKLVMSFVNNPHIRSFKTVRYRIVNIMNDDGSNPTVSSNRIRFQHSALLEVFSRYNISWQLEVHKVLNTSLRNRIVMFGCDITRIGNGYCDTECQHKRTGHDGGDCDLFKHACEGRSIGDGRCDFECNRAYFRWDGGDCCKPGPNAYKTCIDPSSPYR